MPSTPTNTDVDMTDDTQINDEFPYIDEPIPRKLLDPHPRSEMFELGSNVDSLDGAFSSVSQPKKRKTSQMSETNVIREFLAQRPNPFDFLAQKPADDVQQFFDSMSSTVRKFTPLTIARLKLKIAQIVGEEEIAWAENAARFSNRRRKATEALKSASKQKFAALHTKNIAG